MKQMERTGQRVALWDNIKFLLIVLVVVGHFCDVSIDSYGFKNIFIFIYAFHMPLFIFVAGIFHRDHKIAQKVTTYLICGFLLQIIIFTVQLWVDGEGSYSLFNIGGVPWYMFAMAAFIAITYGIRNLNKRLIFVFALVLCCYACYDNALDDMFSWGRIVEFYPFYLLGNLMDPEFFMRIKKHRFGVVAGGAIVASWGAVCLFALDWVYKYRRIFTGHIPFSDFAYETGIKIKVLCLLISVLLCLGVILLMPAKKIPLVSVFGTRTLQVYMWHYPVLVVLADACHLKVLCTYGPAGKVSYVLAAVLVACVLSTKAFGFLTGYIQRNLPKKQSGGKPIPSGSENSPQKEACR